MPPLRAPPYETGLCVDKGSAGAAAGGVVVIMICCCCCCGGGGGGGGGRVEIGSDAHSPPHSAAKEQPRQLQRKRLQ